VSPTRPMRVLAPERARRDLLSRPIYPQVVRLKALAEAEPAVTADEEPASAQAAGIPGLKRAGTTRAVLVTMIGLNFGAVLGLVGWPMLQALKVVNEPVIETVQRNQGEVISQLEATIRTLNATVTELHARVTSAGERQDVDRARLAEIDLAMGALRTSLHEMRTTQDASVAELTANATKARGDIVKLRASIDELKGRQPEATSVRPRIRGTIPALTPTSAEQPRWPDLRASAAKDDGHIFNLAPAQ